MNPKTTDNMMIKALLASSNVAEQLIEKGLTVLGISLNLAIPSIEIERPEDPLKLFGAYNRARGCSSHTLMGSTRMGGCYVEWQEE